MYKVVVYLTTDYSKSQVFECPKSWTKEQITKEVNDKYPIWFSYDIW